MQIAPNQLKGSLKKVGELDGQPVYRAETKGGLFLLMTKTSAGKVKTLGTGSHPAVAASVAEKTHPTIKLTELSKSEQLDAYTLRKQVAEYEQYTRFFAYVTDTE